MSTRVVKLAVITDFACPSCFVMQHELLAAMSYCKDTLQLPLEFEFQHMPFRLITTNCLKPGNTMGRIEFYNCHLGQEKSANLRQCLTKWGEEKDIPITWDGVIGHTTSAHRLCMKALEIGGQDPQLATITAIFKADLVEARDISDHNVLSEIAQSVGVLSKNDALKFLDSNELEDEVNSIADAAREKGITGVPVTIIDGKWAVSGGQSSDVFVQIFKKLAAGGVNSCPSHLPGPAVPTQICA